MAPSGKVSRYLSFIDMETVPWIYCRMVNYVDQWQNQKQNPWLNLSNTFWCAKVNDGSLECRTVASSLELDKSTMKKDAYTITVHLTPKSTWEITRQCV